MVCMKNSEEHKDSMSIICVAYKEYLMKLQDRKSQKDDHSSLPGIS